MKKFILTIALVLFAVSAYSAEIKIGYVDLNKAVNESEEGKKAISILETMVKNSQMEIKYSEDKIKAIEEELKKQASILTPDAIKAKKEERDKLFRNYKRLIKDLDEDVKKKQSRLMEKLFISIRDIVQQIGKAENYSAIYEKAESVTLYYSSELDITDKVITKFNESTKKAD